MLDWTSSLIESNFITILNLGFLTEEFRKRGLKAKFGKSSHEIVKGLKKFGTEYLENIDYKIQVWAKNNTSLLN